jgi:hypothetical protein
MSRLTRLKAALAIISVILFGAGIRQDNTALRWAAIAFLVAALLLRFVKKDRPE